MLFDQFEQEGLLFNMNFKEATSSAGKFAYRGELVLVQGEVGDTSGRRKPPVTQMRQASLLADGDKIVMGSGFIDRVDQLPLFFEKFGSYIAPDASLLFFVVNAAQPCRVAFGGATSILVPLQDGMAWNELIEELKLEKGDFKGQSAADKVLTVAEAFADNAPKYPELPWESVLAAQTDAKREARGPV